MAAYSWTGGLESSWPKDILEWLELQDRPGITSRESLRLRRLAYDPRLNGLAEAICHSGHQLDPWHDAALIFLEKVVSLAAIADILAEKGTDYLKKDLQKFTEATERYLKQLDRNRGFAASTPSGAGCGPRVCRLRIVRTCSGANQGE